MCVEVRELTVLRDGRRASRGTPAITSTTRRGRRRTKPVRLMSSPTSWPRSLGRAREYLKQAAWLFRARVQATEIVLRERALLPQESATATIPMRMRRTTRRQGTGTADGHRPRPSAMSRDERRAAGTRRRFSIG